MLEYVYLGRAEEKLNIGQEMDSLTERSCY